MGDHGHGGLMSATTTAPPVHATPQTLRERAGGLVPSAVAAVLGVLPHVLHHAGPLAGAALLAGAAGTLLFGAIGLVAAIPFLLRVHRRCGNWRVPAALLALFAAIFSVSAFVAGPAITGGGEDSGRAAPAKPVKGEPAPPAQAEEGHAAHH